MVKFSATRAGVENPLIFIIAKNDNGEEFGWLAFKYDSSNSGSWSEQWAVGKTWTGTYRIEIRDNANPSITASSGEFTITRKPSAISGSDGEVLAEIVRRNKLVSIETTDAGAKIKAKVINKPDGSWSATEKETKKKK